MPQDMADLAKSLLLPVVTDYSCAQPAI